MPAATGDEVCRAYPSACRTELAVPSDERDLHEGEMDRLAYDGDAVNETINQAVTMLESLRESHANLDCHGVHVTLSVREMDKISEDELPDSK